MGAWWSEVLVLPPAGIARYSSTSQIYVGSWVTSHSSLVPSVSKKGWTTMNNYEKRCKAINKHWKPSETPWKHLGTLELKPPKNHPLHRPSHWNWGSRLFPAGSGAASSWCCACSGPPTSLWSRCFWPIWPEIHGNRLVKVIKFYPWLEMTSSIWGGSHHKIIIFADGDELEVYTLFKQRNLQVPQDITAQPGVSTQMPLRSKRGGT